MIDKTKENKMIHFDKNKVSRYNKKTIVNSYGELIRTHSNGVRLLVDNDTYVFVNNRHIVK